MQHRPHRADGGCATHQRSVARKPRPVLGRVVVGGLVAPALDASWSLPEALTREEPDLGFLFELEQALAQRERKRAEAPP